MKTIGSEIPTPENWHWKITPQDIAKLRLEDVPTMNKVYFDNYEKFQRIAYRRFKDFEEDAMQSIYVALPYLNYKNAQTFFQSLLWVVRALVYGVGRVYFLSVEAYEESELPNNLVYEDKYFILEDEEKIIEFIASQKTLTDKQKDLLCAAAFGIADYKGVVEDERNYISSQKTVKRIC